MGISLIIRVTQVEQSCVLMIIHLDFQVRIVVPRFSLSLQHVYPDSGNVYLGKELVLLV